MLARGDAAVPDRAGVLLGDDPAARARRSSRWRISIGLTPIALHGQHVPTDPLALAGLIIEGLLVGLAFAFSLAVLMAAVESAGAVIDVSRASPTAALINPMTNEDSAVMARFYSLVGTLIFLVIGGEAWTLRGLARTFQLVPLTSARGCPRSSAAPCRCSATVFTGALEIAAPVMVALLITDVAFGVVSRVVPQLNVFAVGFPTKVAVTLLLVGASLPFVANWISEQLSVSVGAALGALHVSVRPMATRRPHREGHTQASQARAREGPGRAQPRPRRLAGADRGPAGDQHARARQIAKRGLAMHATILGEIATPRERSSAAGLSELMHSALSTIVIAVAPIAGTACSRRRSRTSPRSASVPRRTR